MRKGLHPYLIFLHLFSCIVKSHERSCVAMFLILFLKRRNACTYCFCAFGVFNRKKNSIVYPVCLHLFCTTSQSSKSTETGVSDPPFRVYKKMKQGSEPLFMTTAVVNREVPDIFSGFLLKGGRVPGKPPSKNDFPQKCLFISDFRKKFQTFFFPETAFPPRFLS